MTYHDKRRSNTPDPGDHTNPLMDVASAMAARGDGETDPFNLRLEVRAPRRKQGSKWKKKPGIFYVVHGDDWETTRIPETQPERAKAYLDGVRHRKLNVILGRVMPGALTFATLLADHVANVRASARTSGQRRQANVTEYQVVVLSRFFGQKKLSAYKAQDSIDFKNAYVAERNAHYDANPQAKRKNPEGTATQLLRLLRSSVRLYPARHGLFWSLDIHVPKGDAREPARWFTRPEVARLLKACRGWRWDRRRRRWLSKRNPATKKKRRWLARLIRFALKTGSRHDVMLAITWGSRMNSACVVIDAEGKGWIHRRGYREIDTTKARPSVETLDEMQFLLRGWAKEDGYILPDGTISNAPAHEHLIHPPGGGYFSNHVNRQFADLCRDAGLDDATVHTLKHTAVSWAHQRGITLVAAEQILGTSGETLLKHYSHWGEESRRTGKQEFNDRASRRKLRKLHHFEAKPGDRVRRADRPVGKGRNGKKK
jgi:integrase